MNPDLPAMLSAADRRLALPFLDWLARYGSRITVRTDDVHGLPSAADLLAGVDSGTAVYCCGPVPMTDIELHSERFSVPPVINGRAFTVELENTGEVLEVPADRSLLDVLAEAHPAIPYSCQGFCGTCKLTVIDGGPDHRDSSLTSRNASRAVCCRASPGLPANVSSSAPTSTDSDPHGHHPTRHRRHRFQYLRTETSR